MALAPEQIGIGIRRFFTESGTHPYDMVEWEHREARIQNYKDGTDAFLQPDVEFPVTWSQNATNIVAQKYFRGTLGTAERESSVRQVIDRVADTITAWGVRDGYFVDDDEGAAFRNELKFILLSQRAAFNSPVWFNIGVNGVPQQASACQPYDALVSTPDGLVPIGKLVEDNAIGTKVFDAHGLTQVVAVKANGRKPVLRVHTKAGLTLDVTPDHLVWRTRRGESRGFVEAGTLRPGDQLEWHRSESWGTARSRRARWPKLRSPAGCSPTASSVSTNGTNRSLTIEAMTVTDAERAWVHWAVDTVFPNAHSHERLVETQDTSLDCRRLRLYGNHLAEFVERWGLMTRVARHDGPEHLFTRSAAGCRGVPAQPVPGRGLRVAARAAFVVGLDMISEGIVTWRSKLLSSVRDLLARPLQG